jgi:hypothetical protein
MVMTHAELLREHLAIETEGERTPAQMPGYVDPAVTLLQDDAIRRFKEVRDDGLHAQSLRLTPAMLRHMSPLERKLLLDFIVQRIQLLEVKAALISRNLACGELEIPAIYREVGAA